MIIINLLLILGVFAFITPIIGLFIGDKHTKYLGYLAASSFLISLLYVLIAYSINNRTEYLELFSSPISSALRFDGLSMFFSVVFLFIGFVSALHSVDYMEHDRHLTVYYTLMQLMILGLVGLAISDDLFTFFVFWEGMAISSYILVSFRYHLDEPVEAGMKYLIMSGVGSLLLLYGISFVYGAVGSLHIEEIYSYVGPIIAQGLYIPILIVSLFLVGFGIKAAYFPFWTWLPDAHPAAPSPISALLSGIVIKAGILGIVRFALPFIIMDKLIFAPALMWISIFTMTVANILALLQEDIKRLFAYSSVVNIGFILIGLSAAGYGAVEYGLASALSHVLSHALGKGLAFLAVGAILYSMETREIVKLEGFGRRHPITGFSLAIALLSLAGMPPLPGFWSKWFLILSALSVGQWLLALVGVFNSVLAVIYYVWLIQRFFFSKPTEYVNQSREVSPVIKISLLILVSVMLLIGIYPQIMYELAYIGAHAVSSMLPY